MTQKEYARHAGISEAQVSKYKKQGVLDGAFRKKGKQYFIVSAIADKLLDKHLDPSFRKKSDSPGDEKESFVEARTWTERYKAADRKLSYEIKAGKWILKNEVRDKLFRVGRIARDQFLNFGPRNAAVLAAESDEGKILEICNREIETILKDFILAINEVAK